MEMLSSFCTRIAPILLMPFFLMSGSAWAYYLAVDLEADIKLYQSGTLAERGPVGVYNDKYYYGAYSGEFFILNKEGRKLCSYMTGDAIHSNVVFSSDGAAHFGSRDGYVYALRDDCTLKWKAVANNVSLSVGIGPDGTIYATGGSFLHAFDGMGQEKWAVNVGPWVGIESMGQDGTVFVTSQDTYIRAIDPSGAVKWAYKTQGLNTRLTEPTSDGLIIATPGYSDRWVYALDAATGSLRWKQPFVTYGGDAAFDGNLIYLLNGRDLYSLSPSTGDTIWKKTFDATAELNYTSNSTLVLGNDGYLYFSVNPPTTSTLYAYSKNGDLLASSRASNYEVKNAAPNKGVFLTVKGNLQIQSVAAGEPVSTALPSRYTDLGDTILDTTTNLQWMRCAFGQSWSGNTCTGIEIRYYRSDPIMLSLYSSDYSFAGFSDWRLPSTAEGGTLTYCSHGIPAYFGQESCARNYERPAIHPSAFPNSILETYWASGSITGTCYYMLGLGSNCVTNDVFYFPVRLVRSYTPATFMLKVSTAGSGQGQISSSPSGINCGGDCEESYAKDSSITLTATPMNGSSFAGWGGSCSGTSPSCTVKMTAAKTVGASFALQAVTKSPHDCLFDWAEDNYPHHLSPSRQASQNDSPYYYRHYPTTGSYLGISTTDNHVYFMDDAGLHDLGGFATWRQTSGCQ
jgi:outer membrane protein assembly factor BamB